MAKSEELKREITEKIKAEWTDPNVGWDWKDGVTDEVYAKLCDPENWIRTWKGPTTIGEQVFVIRQFGFGEEDGITIDATVTCDKDDNFLDIEFEQQ
ncbi:MAG: hypothetical protein A2845_03875 [Candidatus Lloydbacteria bacterium RIFCSPHIGHO2_01_FULL_49_22]|uniref:Uncharacterized protein n=1 Tax=Candidatus Lloydbacteria bacterium RIFCSPHIGHO2_01_FULL_49_22 TaxID=1798658 RepID=A0A1G2CXF6_9BACT|nr:MAG: hypothetical protein A2845_03875 [Candidatus Lloydbacteria bacterium RIFCSPHIGHO2_01_FULL_49_22]OGZ09065.1 MAG: hypothetical protein A3C14_03710 [Candidatus Lloydbacteria bacterium RIFCSPHIGHO2_02_FULL_50_18]